MVVDALCCADVEKLRVVERLTRLDRCAVSSRCGGAYDPARTWRENIAFQHALEEFRAVIVVANGDGPFVAAEDVSDEHPLWRVDPGSSIPRDPPAFVSALRLLLAGSTQVAVVDPYFRPDRPEKVEVLRHICEALRARPIEIEIHAADVTLDYREFKRLALRTLAHALPAGCTMRLHYWVAREPGEPGERFHNRYILTDIGGVQFGDSIERGQAGQHDRLSRMGRAERDRQWSMFYGQAPAFERAGEPFSVTSTRGA